MRGSILLILSACLLLEGCEDSAAPLSDPAKASLDKRLIGVWQHKGDGSTSYYHVGHLGGEAPEAVMRVVSVTQFNDGRLQKPTQLLLFPTNIGNTRYLNLAEATEEQLASIQRAGWKTGLLDSYLLLKYRVEEDVLLVWTMKPEAKKKAIEAGQIKGKIEKDYGGDRIRFTDTMQNVAQLVADQGDALFADEPIRFERVR